MSDESFQEKTEAPTPKKRKEARSEGQVAKSQELTTAIMLLAAGGVVALAGAALGSSMTDAFRHLAMAGSAPPQTIEGYDRLFNDVGRAVAGTLIPVLVALTGTAGLVAGLQARGILTVKPLKPKFERIAPHTNIKNMYGVKPWADLGKSLLKLTVIAAVMYPLFSAALHEMADLAMKPAAGLVETIQSHAVKLLLDEIFGPGCFQREIVWRIGWISGFKTRARNWIRNHDLIFFYTKDPQRFTFNKSWVPHPKGYERRAGRRFHRGERE